MSSNAAKPSGTRVDPRIAETRRLVKQATLDLIAEVGFEGTTVERIAEHSGVSRTTIYRHWPDPAVLFLEAFDPPSEELSAPVPTGDVIADLHAFIHHVADRLNDERFAAALSAQIDKGRRDPAYREAHLRYAEQRNRHGVELFRSGVESGALRANLVPEHEVDLILSFLTYQRLLRYRVLDAEIVDALYRDVIARCAAPKRRRGTPGAAS